MLTRSKMITEDLQKKIDRAIRLLKGYNNPNEPVEIAYSGGKDSDVILQLAKESGINYRAIYKNTTIDPPGTIAHAKAMGAEMIVPKTNFFELVAKMGFPNRFQRFCCRQLKEYKVLDKSVMGVRKAESTKRMQNYNEPTECRFYGSKKEHVEAIYPILDWSDEDVVNFIEDRGIKLHPLYYREDGTIDPKRRLGCMCCPLAYYKKRLEYFKQYPNMVKAYIKAGQKWRDTHPDAKATQKYKSIYEHFFREVFFERQNAFDEYKRGIFGEIDYKEYLENYFKIKL